MTSTPIDEVLLKLHQDPESLGLIKPKRKEYPSVSTILRETGDSSGLDRWRARVGEEEANRISKAAAERGTALHTIIETHFKPSSETVSVDEAEEVRTPQSQYLLNSIIPYLSRIRPVSFETPLWSDVLRINGRADCIGYYDNVLSVIDFKSSSKEKNDMWITDYYLQATLYAMMVMDLTSIPIHQIVILIGVERGDSQLFKKETKLFVPQAFRRVKLYHSIERS